MLLGAVGGAAQTSLTAGLNAATGKNDEQQKTCRGAVSIIPRFFQNKK